jgi:TonB family protein
MYSGKALFNRKSFLLKRIFILPSIVGCLAIMFCSSISQKKNFTDIVIPLTDTIPSPANDTSSIFVVVDVMPVFPGGIDSLTNYLTKRIVYSREALSDRAEGTVYVSFVINLNGSTSKIKIIKGIHKSLDRIAIEAVRNMPHWKAGMIKGKPVRTQVNLPIRFMLPTERQPGIN